MSNPLNFGILQHPLNWATVLLMVFFAGVAVHFIFPHAPHKQQ